MTWPLEHAGLMAPLEQLGFAWPATAAPPASATPPLDEAIAEAIEKHELVTAPSSATATSRAGSIPSRARVTSSPPLVVAFAPAGRIDVDLTTEPLGIDDDGRPVLLADIRPRRTRSATSSAI